MAVRCCLSHQFRISFRRLRQREAVHKEYYKVQCHRNSSIHNHSLTSSVQLMAFNFSGKHVDDAIAILVSSYLIALMTSVDT
ncbi:hypothetical protein P8452_02576 [Trifolium repens]|nr:hypothetical protein P8452_02576 [Trifolium repens]